ncbi:ArnT family glycosyltransferase [Tundrisphaera lichenicola]|uniref:ArnT family glycosyltransferase n=1 Tax=Tundrisphaera lichenicola TaxID=2029860 RepID=UPI003EBB615A
MARRRASSPPPRPPEKPPTATAEPTPTRSGFWSRSRVALAVVLILATHGALAVDSLLQENATVDEVAHMPAGVTYWQTGTFKLYHHNPPVVKLIAALPVVLANPTTAPLYEMSCWAQESQTTFGELFAFLNFKNYLELFSLARLTMPIFSIVGGLVVFAWSSRLYGPGGGLLSLALWSFCPNVLAHGRLVTTDVAAASIGAGATYLFWRYQKNPTWTRAVIAGLVLGLAQLTKFSLILLYGFWPALALLRFLLDRRGEEWPRRLAMGLAQFAAMVAISVAVIDAGYAFEGVGTPLGKYEFASGSLTRPVPPGMARPSSFNPLLDSAWKYRVNRFRGTILADLPVPLPKHYLLGFDEQKVETEGVPEYFFNPGLPHDDAKQTGYSVYLDGELRRGGWWYYYLATLVYKVPEGTWVLVILSAAILVASKRSRAPWVDEISVLALPVGVLGAMSFLTDICLGLRYILPVFPYVFIATGKVVPWVAGLRRFPRWVASAVLAGSLAGNAISVALIHPDYLAYFNWASGGPDRGGEHLIDSNLDWGQDLVKLDRWLKANRPGRDVGLAYFGQINPSLMSLRGGGFRWFLPPALPGTAQPLPGRDLSKLIGPARELRPGLYAVSASIVQGLPWRFYDSISLDAPQLAWTAAWNVGTDAFGYFRELTPVARVGHSIYVYELSEQDCKILGRHWQRASLVE